MTKTEVGRMMERTATDALREVQTALSSYVKNITMREIAELLDSERARKAVHARIEYFGLKLEYTIDEVADFISTDLLELLADSYRGYEIHDDVRTAPLGKIEGHSAANRTIERIYDIAPNSPLARVRDTLLLYIPFMIDRVIIASYYTDIGKP